MLKNTKMFHVKQIKSRKRYKNKNKIDDKTKYHQIYCKIRINAQNNNDEGGKTSGKPKNTP